MPPKRKSTEAAQSTEAQKRARSDQGTAPFKLELPRNLRLTPGSATADADIAWIKLWEDPTKAFEYVSIAPLHYGDKGTPGDDGEESEDEDEDANADTGEDEEGTSLGAKPLDESSDNSWIITHAGFEKCASAQRLCTTRDPDELAMYTFNDHYGYGTLELVENFMLDFDLAKSNWKEQWTLCEALGLFIRHGSADAMMQIDDSEGAEDISRLIKTLFLTMLATLERNSVLKPDSEIKNLGHMMALWLRLSEDPSSIFGVLQESAGTRRLGSIIMAYATKYDIPLPNPGNLDSLKKVVLPKAMKVKLPAPDAKRNDPWNWTKALKDYERNYNIWILGYASRQVGGDQLDVSAWTSERRARCAFDEKDPITEEVRNSLKPPGGGPQ